MTDTELQQKRLIAAAIDAGIAIGLGVVTAIVALIAGMISHWLYLLVMLAGMMAWLGLPAKRRATKLGLNRSCRMAA